jgi:hypothetical protein
VAWVVGCAGPGPLGAEDFRLLADGGIDDRLNSYPWAVATFDGDGDGAEEVYVGTMGNALCLQVPLAFDLMQSAFAPTPPDRWRCDETHWDPTNWTSYVLDNAVPPVVFRGTWSEDGATYTWDRVFEPNLLVAAGFRGAVVYEGALYMLGMSLTSGAMVWKSTDGVEWEEASERGLVQEHAGFNTSIRAATVFRDRLYVASASNGYIYASDDPAPGNWEVVTSEGLVDSGAEARDTVFSAGTSTGANTENTLNDTEQAWMPNTYGGGAYVVRVNAGTGEGQSRTILSNTAQTLTIEGTWEPIPDDTSTYEVYRPDAPVNGPFWDLAVLDDRLYAAPLNMDGGELWYATDPAPGGWSRVIEGGFGQPDTQGFMTVTTYGEHIYLGTVVYPPLVTDIEGIVGTEILRVDAVGNTELLVGATRDVEGQGQVAPLSGIGPGFDYGANVYSWTALVHEDRYYLGTFDAALLVLDFLDEMFANGIPDGMMEDLEVALGTDHDRWKGFDLYVTEDGESWTTITEDGLGDLDNYGVRSLTQTEQGLLLGAANPIEGFELWLGAKE